MLRDLVEMLINKLLKVFVGGKVFLNCGNLFTWNVTR